MTPTWEDLVNWGALGPDICGAVPHTQPGDELIFCRMKVHPRDGRHLDYETGWMWRDERQPRVG